MTNSSNNATPTVAKAATGPSVVKSPSSNALAALANTANCERSQTDKKNSMASRKISSTSFYEESNQCSNESILPSMNRFINSINNMTSVVMFPSKLYDYEGEEEQKKQEKEKEAMDSKSVHSLSSEEDSLSHSSSVSSNLMSLESTGTNTATASSDDSGIQHEQQQQPQQSANSSLYDSYRMLIQAKEQLLWGTNARDDEDDSPLSAQFRESLSEMNRLLTQFADLAEQISDKYQNQYEN